MFGCTLLACPLDDLPGTLSGLSFSCSFPVDFDQRGANSSHKHSDPLSPSCCGASRTLSAGTAPKQNWWSDTTLWEKKQTQPLSHSSLTPKHMEVAVPDILFTGLCLFILLHFSVHVLLLWLQVITFHYLGNRPSFVGPPRSLPIRSLSCFVTVKQTLTSPYGPKGKNKRRTRPASKVYTRGQGHSYRLSLI